MAATSQDRDYVHILMARLLTDYDVTYEIVSAVPWELMHHDRAETLPLLNSALKKRPDVVVLQFGENSQDFSTIDKDMSEMVSYIQENCHKAEIVMIGTFWMKNDLDEIKKYVCLHYCIKFLDLSPIRNVNRYMLGMGTTVSGNDGKMHKNHHLGVSVHPNDLAMEYYASRLEEIIRNIVTDMYR